MLQQKALKFVAVKCHALENYIENQPLVTPMSHRDRTCIFKKQTLNYKKYKHIFNIKCNKKPGVTNKINFGLKDKIG